MILPTSSLFAVIEFIGRHPGLLLVLIGVAGEIICDWKEIGTGRLARAKKISAILLVIGLMMEFWEAAKSDEEIARLTVQAADSNLEAKLAETNAAASYKTAAAALREAAQSNERAAKFDSDRVMVEKEAEEIRATNFVLQAKVLKLEGSLSPRQLTDEQIATITKFLQGTPRGLIQFDWLSSDEETVRYKNQLANFFKQLGYDVFDRDEIAMSSSPIVGISMGIEGTNKYPSYALYIQKAFDAAGVDLPGYIDRNITNAIVIKVGTKPSF
ncbi:MAG: hypothetical protein ACREC8_07650 [Limisphaerales bacterium]